MILACDVGGTKTTLALIEPSPAGLRVARRETYRSREHASLDEIVGAFVGRSPPELDAAGFGVAGPVLEGRARTTNLPWIVDGSRLARALGLARVSVLNDVEALAWSVPRLGAAEQAALQAGASGPGTVAVVAVGTGFGCAALVRGGSGPRSLASEGGHADFAPTNEDEIELFRVLQTRFDHVSVERVVSGPGIFEIYEFLRARDGGAPSFAVAPDDADPTAAVARAALEGRSALAERAVLLFLGCFGAEAGNWALRTMATGGVWLGGGVARKLLIGPAGTSEAWRARAAAAFLTRFRNKGRFSPMLATVPIQVVMTDDAPLFGAAELAVSEAGHGRGGRLRS